MSAIEDARLCALAQSGNTRAADELIRRHSDIAYAQARLFFASGHSDDDTAQEALLGLFFAIRNFRADGGSAFRTFANLCVHRQIITYVKLAHRQKHKPLNESARAGRDSEGEWAPVVDLLPSRHADPAHALATKEELARLTRGMATLSPLERHWLLYAADGGLYSANVNGRRNKSAENAVDRARKKLRDAA